MTKTFSTSRFTICLVAGFLSAASGAGDLLYGQQSTVPARPISPSTLVAVVDIPRVFENHSRFKADMDGIEKQLKNLEREFESKRTELEARSKQLKDLNPTSDDYRRLESEIARAVADLQVQARQVKKQYTQREARLYFDAYNEILAAVNKVAADYSISLVLRYDNTKMDPENPQSVMIGMSRTILVHRNIDITDNVIQELPRAIALRNNQGRAPRR